MKKKEFTIQIEASATYSKTIKAESMEQALGIANLIKDDNNIIICKPAGNWCLEWNNERKIIGIFQ